MLCYYNPALGQAKHVERSEHSVIVQLNNLQIIGLYIRPQCSSDQVVEAIMSALKLTDPEIPTLLVGVLNCQMDRMNSKSQALLELMEGEGFTCTNAAQTAAYISNNGSSTTDLIFY